jgi:hypothetical protein
MPSDDDDLPFCVFLDTEAYRSALFNWMHPILVALRERIRKGSIELVITDIVLREMQHDLPAGGLLQHEGGACGTSSRASGHPLVCAVAQQRHPAIAVKVAMDPVS